MSAALLIDQGIYIVSQGVDYDIHNEYIVKSIDSSLAMASVELAKLDGSGSIIVAVIKLDHFEYVSGDSLFIDEIGYKSRSDTDLSWLSNESSRRQGDDFVIRLEGEGFIRMGGEGPFIHTKA